MGLSKRDSDDSFSQQHKKADEEFARATELKATIEGSYFTEANKIPLGRRLCLLETTLRQVIATKNSIPKANWSDKDWQKMSQYYDELSTVLGRQQGFNCGKSPAEKRLLRREAEEALQKSSGYASTSPVDRYIACDDPDLALDAYKQVKVSINTSETKALATLDENRRALAGFFLKKGEKLYAIKADVGGFNSGNSCYKMALSFLSGIGGKNAGDKSAEKKCEEQLKRDKMMDLIR